MLCLIPLLRHANVTDYPKFYKSVHSMPLRLQIPSGFGVRSMGTSRIFQITVKLFRASKCEQRISIHYPSGTSTIIQSCYIQFIHNFAHVWFFLQKYVFKTMKARTKLRLALVCSHRIKNSTTTIKHTTGPRLDKTYRF